MDTLLKILQTPLGTILALAGIAIVFFAFFEVGKGIVKMRRTPKDGLVPAVIGAILIVGGLLLSKQQTAAVEPTPLEPTSIAVAYTQAPPVLPTDTPFPTETTAPSETPVVPTETASPVPLKTIADGCFDKRTWQADSTEATVLSAIVDENNCWNLESLGITAEGGTLHFLPKPPRAQISSGIYTQIGNQSIIEFKVYVSSLYLVYEGEPAYISFSIAPQDNAMARTGSGRFKLQVKDTTKSPLIFFMLADTSEANGNPLATRHYEYKNTYDVRLQVKGISMNVYINGIDTKETVSIPSGPKVLYVGYNLPLQAGVDATIKEITVDGVSK